MRSMIVMLTMTAGPLTTSSALAQKQENEPISTVTVPVANAEDFSKWAKAYQRAGRPKTMILVGWESPTAPARSVLEFLEPDAAGISERFRVSLSRVLGQPEMRFREIDPVAINESRQRLANTLALRNERQGVDLLANTADAELVILVKLQGVRGRAPETVIFQPIDYSQGMRLRPLPPIDWSAKGFGIDDQTILDNLSQMAKRFIDDYYRFVVVAAEGRDYTLRVFGLTNEQLPLARRVLKGINGVDNFQDENVSVGLGESMTEFEVGFRGSPGDFREAVQVALASISPGIEAVSFKGEGGTLNVRVTSKGGTATPTATAPTAARGCDTLLMERSDAGATVRAQLTKLYEKKNAPRVAVLINRAPASSKELAAAGVTSGGKVADALVVVNNQQNNGGAAGEENEEFRTLRELDRLNLELETKIYDRLGTRLLSMRRSADSGVLRAQVAAAVANTSTSGSSGVVSADLYAAALRQSDAADLYIIGRGSVEKLGEGAVRTRWVFRAIDSGGRLVATAEGLDGTLASGLSSGVLDAIADQALAKLFCEVMAEWRQPNITRLTLTGITSADDWAALRGALSKADPALGIRLLGDGQIGLGSADPSASSDLTFDCSRDQLERELQRLSAEMPFKLQLQASDSRQLRLSVKR